MRKATEYKVEDSNVEKLGSAEDKAARLAAAQTEKEWEGAGQKVGLEIWRVENRRTADDKPDFGVKRWPKDQYGHFYKGDSYIIMNTFLESEDAAKFSFDLHFWIGEESSQDEYGVAAYKTVELDDLLGGDPVQHRQTMGNESALFLSYFPNGLIIKSGGIESGFRKVKPRDYKPSLLQVQRIGKQCRAFEVDLSIESMDSTDCFILDAGQKIYVYHGSGSSAFEKTKATSMGENMEAERGGRAERVDPDARFWELLGGTESDVTAKGDHWTPPIFETPKLYSMHDETHQWELVKEGTLSAGDLRSDDVMMIDCNEKLFVYCGNDAPLGEVSDCMIMADRFLAKAGTKTTPIVRVKEGQTVGDEVYDKCFGITKAAGKSAGGGGAAAPAFGQHMLQKKKKAPRQAAKALHSGTLFKKEGLRSKWNERFFELQPTQLVFYTAEGGEERGAIPLEAGMTARESECPSAMPGEMELVNSERTIRIRTMRGDRDTWVAKLGEALAAL